MIPTHRLWIAVNLIVAALLISSCQPSVNSSETSTPGLSISLIPPSLTPQATEVPDLYALPYGFNPLTGQPVSDPKLLKTPAMLVSISHFPATARPQAGLSFAPYVFEFYITEGATRFLTVFYGDFPYPEIPITGNCAVRMDAFRQTDTLLGNRIWLDANANGLLDTGEQGIGGICVNLYDGRGNLIQSTSTDTNGYYGFNVQSGQQYVLEIVKPDTMQLAQLNAGDEKLDSDFDPATNRTPLISVPTNDLDWDAGLTLSETAFRDPAYLPPAQVGPVRSGRLVYAHLGAAFQSSCLVDAFASPEVLEKIPQCAFVQHDLAGGGYMFNIDDMQEIALQNKRKTSDVDFNYFSNIYSDQPPIGGRSASKINVYISYLNQSGWVYDPLYQSWLRYVDTSDESLAGVLFADTDRLNRRQLHFENIILLYARHEVITPTNLDIHLEAGKEGPGLLFRDGEMYQINWSTQPGKYEEETDLRRPIQFFNEDNTPAPLKPGHTWVIIVTQDSEVFEESSGIWKINFVSPEGAQQ